MSCEKVRGDIPFDSKSIPDESTPIVGRRVGGANAARGTIKKKKKEGVVT